MPTIRGRRKGAKTFISLLAVVSIIGFATILVNAFTGINLGPWADALLFILIGTGLIVIGGVRMLFKYFDNGLETDEISKIFTIAGGLLAIVIGLLSLPLGFLEPLNVPAFDGIRGFIALFAIILIAVQTWLRK